MSERRETASFALHERSASGVARAFQPVDVSGRSTIGRRMAVTAHAGKGVPNVARFASRGEVALASSPAISAPIGAGWLSLTVVAGGVAYFITGSVITAGIAAGVAFAAPLAIAGLIYLANN